VLIAAPQYIEPVNALRPTLPCISEYVALAGADPDWLAFEDWIVGQPETAPRVAVEPNADLLQIYTSGTTGQPKGAVLTQHGVVSNTLQIASGPHRGSPGERTLVVGPMLHAGVIWMALAPLAWGASMYILDEFNADHVVKILDTEAIGYAALVPTMLQACVNVPGAADREFASLRLIHTGAAAISDQTLRRAAAVFKCDITQGYGLTESSAGATVMAPADTRRALNGKPDLLRSVGRPLLGTEVRIIDEREQPAAPGVAGEVVVRGPQLMRGYWKQPRATAETLRNGWLRTGDVGRMDADGFLYIEDRLKDMIVSGGINIYPRMVERVLEMHPAVAEVAAIGVPDTHWGESVKAVVVVREGLSATEAELIEFCRDKLGGFQRPRSIDFVTALPRTATGKVMRRAVREPYWADQRQRVGQV
jgi:fatty-acyl-CoA synthase